MRRVAGFWSDGATKERHLALPNGTSIALQADSDFDLPVGTVLVKHFSLASRRVETRLFMRHTDGEWAGYTYEWNAQGTDATRVVGGKSVAGGWPELAVPERERNACSATPPQRAARWASRLAQLNAPVPLSADLRTANQVQTLQSIRLFTRRCPRCPRGRRCRIPWQRGTWPERARAYLHTNCANCHRPGGGTPSDLDLRYTTPLASTNSCDRHAAIRGSRHRQCPYHRAGRRQPFRAGIARMQRRDAAAMPPLASTVVDAAGVALLTSWINGLTNCN